MRCAIEKNNIRAIQKLVEDNKATLCEKIVKGEDEFTPLGYAIYYKRKEIAKYLISSGANVNEQSKYQDLEKERDGNTSWRSPIYMAILADEPDLVQLLINKRADVELGRTIQKNDERPFKLPLTLALHSTEKVAITQMLFDQQVKLRWAKNVLDDLIPKTSVSPAKKSKLLFLLNFLLQSF